ncbi:hypothetical protein D3C71_449030 [compost metagenome]
MEFNETIQCDEVSDKGFTGPMWSELREHFSHDAIDMEATAAANEDTRVYTLLSEHLVMIAEVDGTGKLLSAAGFNAKVEQVEMDTVKITKNGEVVFLELSDNVQWIKEREV